MPRHVIPVFLAVLLSGCGGGGGDDGETDTARGEGAAPICAYIHGGGTTALVISGCATCSVTDASAAIDGDPDTFASINFPDGVRGTMALRGIAQQGVVYPSGSAAGVLISAQGTGSRLATSDFVLRTYLDGVPTGSSISVSPNGFTGANNSSRHRIQFESLAPFDAVELSYTSGGGLGTEALRIHEFCSD